MSITFYVDGWYDAPSKRVKSYADVEYPCFDAEYLSIDPFFEREEDTGRFYRWVEVYEGEWPELNMGNTNAKNLLVALGFQPDYSGEIPADQIATALRRCVRLTNSAKAQKPHDYAPYAESDRFFCGGFSVAEKAKLLMPVLREAANKKTKVYWA